MVWYGMVPPAGRWYGMYGAEMFCACGCFQNCDQQWEWKESL